ncbi:hypothetical protein [Companilactobacillus kimchii]|uniref:Uncharacterized protein n=2 Tax=Companilactobacillus kimchii TaxID=2801452 RepID=A0ABR5NUR0_9LACO|nr:hypothetical protein [Companilactobacillus kimchii]KAE9557337.1 hypothetical protein ATN91_04115 [Companilactobacillus kimchii]KRK52442.1 hypothetical protein FC97_GL000244 [Companilactobacillus kimchii DSM 13961 = JCM 10707]OWF32559.1 hypothetical protein LKACC12383_01782 [Companilactobacillus kimchii]GEO47360.1 hypothetical protein LKI01_13590 [Companilactobacillus paralimentarius]
MKKISISLIFLLIIILAINITKFKGIKETHKSENSEELVKNESQWKKLTKDIPQIAYHDNLPLLERIQMNYENPKDGHSSKYEDKFSLKDRFYADNPTIFEGVVLNLEPMSEMVETKATILVKKVWHGDQSVKNKRIYTVFRSGITKAKYAFSSIEGEHLNKKFNPDQKVLMVRKDIPVPKIGSVIIGSFKSFKMTSEAYDSTRQNIYDDKYGINFDQFYLLKNPRTNLWVKDKKRFILNNPEFKKLKDNTEFKNLYALTDYWK